MFKETEQFYMLDVEDLTSAMKKAQYNRGTGGEGRALF